MRKRNYKELWEQLKVVVSCGSRKRWGKNEVLETMTSLEVYQIMRSPAEAKEK